MSGEGMDVMPEQSERFLALDMWRLVVLVCVIPVTIWSGVTMVREQRSGRDLDTLVRVECALHHDQADVRKLCRYAGK